MIKTIWKSGEAATHCITRWKDRRFHLSKRDQEDDQEGDNVCRDGGYDQVIGYNSDHKDNGDDDDDDDDGDDDDDNNDADDEELRMMMITS